MNRRAFLTRSLAVLPLPAFARAASLWLPPERPFFVPDTETDYSIEWITANAEGVCFVDEERWAILMNDVVDDNLPLKVQILVRDILDGEWKSPADVWGVEIPLP